jgi:hypothetical protein
MKPTSLAVALNCGIRSISLKADVRAFDRLQIVRDRNSSYFGHLPNANFVQRLVAGACRICLESKSRVVKLHSVRHGLRKCRDEYPTSLDDSTGQ